MKSILLNTDQTIESLNTIFQEFQELSSSEGIIEESEHSIKDKIISLFSKLKQLISDSIKKLTDKINDMKRTLEYKKIKKYIEDTDFDEDIEFIDVNALDKLTIEYIRKFNDLEKKIITIYKKGMRVGKVDDLSKAFQNMLSDYQSKAEKIKNTKKKMPASIVYNWVISMLDGTGVSIELLHEFQKSVDDCEKEVCFILDKKQEFINKYGYTENITSLVDLMKNTYIYIKNNADWCILEAIDMISTLHFITSLINGDNEDIENAQKLAEDIAKDPTLAKEYLKNTAKEIAPSVALTTGAGMISHHRKKLAKREHRSHI